MFVPQSSFLTVVIIVFVASEPWVFAGNWDDDTLGDFLDAFDSATRSTPTPSFRQWDRYLANSSLVGFNAPCSAREKSCISRRQLLNSATGGCVYHGDVRRGETSCRWVLDAEALRTETGVRAACVPVRTPECPWGYKMAYDGRCFDGYRLFTRICPRTRGLEPGVHATGGVECICSGGACDREDYEDGAAEEDATGGEASDDEDEDAVNLSCRLPPLHAPVTPPTEAPVAQDVFSYHFDHSHEREH